jgi:hypothetical protein
MKRKSFLEAAKSLATDYGTDAIVHLQNDAGNRISPGLDVFIESQELQAQWKIVCVQVAAPIAVAKSEPQPRISEEGVKE